MAKDDPLSVVDSTEMLCCCWGEGDVYVELSDCEA